MQTILPLYGFGGGSGGEGGTLTILSAAGSTVTISKDGKSKTKIADASGVAKFSGLSSGMWDIIASTGGQSVTKTVIITVDYSTEIGFSTIPDFTYTGSYAIVNDQDEPISESSGNWKIRFLTSGTLRITALNGAGSGVDVFLVGGGGGGTSRGGGGGGYTKTVRNKSLTTGEYSITIGNGGSSSGAGGNTSAFGASANGGSTGSGYAVGGAGGSGGGGGGNSNYSAGAGGSDGGDGGDPYAQGYAGSGQDTTTREFGESSGTLYAGGGGGGGSNSSLCGAGGSGGGGSGGVSSGKAGTANTGGGGGGAYNGSGGKGGSGIVVIRNKR